MIFLHGGLRDHYVRRYAEEEYDDTDAVLGRINLFGYTELWFDSSPLWLRPQYSDFRMYKEQELLQVVGHTPVTKVMRKGNVISCDVFSTDRYGRPIGTQEFPVIETTRWDIETVQGK